MYNFHAGLIWIWGGTIANIPTGWLFCNGAAISRTTYARLFAAIGTMWGSGNGSTTFNLPNLTNRVIAGANADVCGIAKSAITGSALQCGGCNSHAHSVSQASHSHSFSGSSSGHSHSICGLSHSHDYSGSTSGHDHSYSGTTDACNCYVSVECYASYEICVSDCCHTHGYSGSTNSNSDSYSGTTSSALDSGYTDCATDSFSGSTDTQLSCISTDCTSTVTPFAAATYVIKT